MTRELRRTARGHLIRNSGPFDPVSRLLKSGVGASLRERPMLSLNFMELVSIVKSSADMTGTTHMSCSGRMERVARGSRGLVGCLTGRSRADPFERTFLSFRVCTPIVITER